VPATGSIAEDGGVTMSVLLLDGQTLTCSGKLEEDTIIQDCLPDGCHVVLKKS
jgi:hypothetical protein